MNRLNSKDYKLRQQVRYKEFKLLLLKSLFLDQRIEKNLRIKIHFHIQKYIKSHYFTKVKNKCVLTGRSRGIYSKYKLSRIKLREYLLSGYIVGYSKASW